MEFIKLAVWLLIGSFWTYYATSVMLLEEKMSHYGPFPSSKKQISWSITFGMQFREYKAPVTWFDHIRRIFGVYAIAKDGDGYETWHVKESRAELWTCPKCLSFWMALIPTAGYALSLQLPSLEVFFLPFALAGISYFLFKREPVYLPMGALESTTEDNES